MEPEALPDSQNNPLPLPSPQSPPIPLNYTTADPNRPAGGLPYIAQMALGLVAFLMAGGLSYGAILGSDNSTFYWAFWIPIGAILALTVASTYVWYKWNWRGFLLGIILGFALLFGGFLLLLGLCMGMFGR